MVQRNDSLHQDDGDDEGPLPIMVEDMPAIRKSLVVYRVMAWITGCLLVLLVLVAMPVKYLFGDGFWVTVTGLPHGWLYMVLVIAAFNLGRRVSWPYAWLLLVMLAGTVPFLSFVAEHYATKDVRAKLAAVDVASPPSE